jgi:conjugative transfer region protein TrbK
MRTVALVTSFAAIAALGACSPKPTAAETQRMSAPELKAQVDRCARGGRDTANDPSCKQASDENFRRFLGKDPKR